MKMQGVNLNNSVKEQDDLTHLKKKKKINKLSYILISLNFGLSSLADLSIQYFCKDVLKLQPSELSRYITFTQIPWIMKPLFGLLTDSLPIFGKRRKYYIIICGLMGFLAWLLVAFFAYSLSSLIFFLTLMNASLSFSSVLGEAIVVELSKLESKNNKEIELQRRPENIRNLTSKIKEVDRDDIIKENDKNCNFNSNLSKENQINDNKNIEYNSDSDAKDFISLFFFFKYTGALISSLLKGYLIKYFSYSTIFLITGSISFLTIISGMIFIEDVDLGKKNDKNKESKNTNNGGNSNLENIFHNSENKIGIKYRKLSEETVEKKNSNKNNFNSEIDSSENFDRKISSSKFLDDAKTDDLNLDNHKDNIHKFEINLENEFKDHEKIRFKDQMRLIYRFIFQKYILVPTLILIIFMSTPSYDDPFFYFFTEELKLNSVDLSLISTFSIIFTLIAIAIYKWKLKKYSFKTMITGCSLVSFTFSFMSYILTKRYNLIIGIPDFLLILFSTSVNSLLGELTMMPMLSLACLLSPKNLEGTAYSIFMSALNLGGGLSIIFGSFLTQYMAITANDFRNLPNMILISNMMALLPLPLICFFGNSYFSPERKIEEKSREIGQ